MRTSAGRPRRRAAPATAPPGRHTADGYRLTARQGVPAHCRRPPPRTAAPWRAVPETDTADRRERRRRPAARARGPAPAPVWSSSSRRPRPRRSPASSARATSSRARIGHIRDLPRNAADVPASHKGQAWARLGVDVDNDFQTLYVVSADKKQQVAKLKALLKDADELFLATDEDREGEAIAWHLLETLNPKVPVRRMVFHEITPQAIQHAVETPARARPGAGRRAGDPPRPRPPLRLRGQPGPVEEGHAEAVGGPRAVGGDPRRRRARARADGASGRRSTGTSRATSSPPPTRATRPPRASSPRRCTRLDGKRLATGASFEQTTGGLKDGLDVVLLDEASARDLVRAARRRGRSASGRPTRSPTPASRTRRS